MGQPDQRGLALDARSSKNTSHEGVVCDPGAFVVNFEQLTQTTL
jgi:hypothetical protein